MDEVDFEKISVKHPRVDQYYTKPGISISLYCDKPVQILSPFIADAIELYMGFIGPNKLLWYAAPNSWRELKKRKLDKDLKILRDFPSDYTDFEVEYNQNGGVVEDYYFRFIGNDLNNNLSSEKTNLLRLDFPHNVIQQTGLDSLLDFILNLSNTVPFQSGNIGFGFKINSATYDIADDGINRWLPRYFGFDPCDHNLRHSMRNKTLMAHWINLIDEELMDQLGGFDAICKAVPGADIHKLDHGLFIRGAKMPPIGDINYMAPDIGCLPEVARLLKPTRVQLETYFPFDSMAWLERFDTLENRAWEFVA